MEKYAFNGRILVIGCGSIGQGVVPLILRHFTVTPDRMTIVTADKRGENVADVMAIAMPLRLDSSEYAIAVAGPMPRMQDALNSHRDHLLQICAQIEGGK